MCRPRGLARLGDGGVGVGRSGGERKEIAPTTAAAEAWIAAGK